MKPRTRSQARAQARLRAAAARRMVRVPSGLVRLMVATIRKLWKEFASEVVDWLENRVPSRVLSRARADSKSWMIGFGEKIKEALESMRGKASRAYDAIADRVRKYGLKAAKTALQVQYTELGMNTVIERYRDEFAALIDKAGRGYGDAVRMAIEGPDAPGLRWEELKARILRQSDVDESRAELIARDQILKLHGRIQETRQRNAGIERYTWSSSRDERVRETHAELDGTVQSWNAPPIVDRKKGRREHPGGDFQCRCVAIPLIPGVDD